MAPTSCALFLDQPLAFWVREYIGDLLHDREAARAELIALRGAHAKDKAANVHERRRHLMGKLNALNELTDYPPEVLDAQSERDRLTVAQGQKPERFARIEEFLRAHPEPR